MHEPTRARAEITLLGVRSFGLTALLSACLAACSSSSPADKTDQQHSAGSAGMSDSVAGAPGVASAGASSSVGGAAGGSPAAGAGGTEMASAGASGAQAGAAAGGATAGGASGGAASVGGGGGSSSLGGAAGSVGKGSYACNLMLGLSATAEWFPKFVDLVGGSTWEGINREHEYINYWAQFAPDRVSASSPVRSDIWAEMPTPPCANAAKAPERAVLVAFAETSNATYNDYSNLNDVTVRSNWVTALEKVVSLLQMKFPSVRSIELMTMIRGPGSAGPGKDCDTAANSSHDDIVEPWVDDAIATVVGKHPQLVSAAPKFYVDDCSWFNGAGPHFVPSGHPELVAQKVAAYYSANP